MARNQRLLLALVSVWLAALYLAAWLSPDRSVAASIVYLACSQICHQIPDRSFAFDGHTLPVCARCLGLYWGFWLGLILVPTIQPLRSWLLARPRWILLFAVPMAIDLLSPNTHWSRLITGMVAAFPIPLFVLLAVEQLPESFSRFIQPRRI